MTDQPRVVDGADRRKVRLLELLAFIHENQGATTQQCQGFMTMRFGLRSKTTYEYLMELHLNAKCIRRGGLGAVEKWFTTGNIKKYAKWLYSGE